MTQRPERRRGTRVCDGLVTGRVTGRVTHPSRVSGRRRGCSWDSSWWSLVTPGHCVSSLNSAQEPWRAGWVQTVHDGKLGGARQGRHLWGKIRFLGNFMMDRLRGGLHIQNYVFHIFTLTNRWFLPGFNIHGFFIWLAFRQGIKDSWFDSCHT